MRVKDIKLSQRYAVTVVTPGHSHAVSGTASKPNGRRFFPRTAPVIHALCVDIAGNTVVFERDTMVLSDKGIAKRAENPDQLVGNANYVPGKELLRVPAHRVICLSDEWAPPAPDGRLDAPEVHRAAGHTFTSERLATTA